MANQNGHISKLLSLLIGNNSQINKEGNRRLYLWTLMVAVYFASTMPLGEACYLRNCPLGKREGKRADGSEEPTSVINNCPACGANGAGQCLGPFTCCTPGAGCVIGVGVPETVPCTRETNNPIPCTSDGKKCGYNGEGVCSAKGVCCTEDRCEFTVECGLMHPSSSDFRKLIRGF